MKGHDVLNRVILTGFVYVMFPGIKEGGRNQKPKGVAKKKKVMIRRKDCLNQESNKSLKEPFRIE